MSEKTFLGEFEQMVLLAILRTGEDAYAVPIRREIEERAQRQDNRGMDDAAVDEILGTLLVLQARK